MRRAACIWLAVLATVGVVGSAAGAAATGWHVTPVRSLGKRIGGAEGAAVNRFGTSVVVFGSPHFLMVARHAAGASKFKVSKRVPANSPSDCPGCQVYDLTALADGRFLLVYTNGLRLLARDIDSHGRLRGPPHLLATLYQRDSIYALPLAAVDSDASRAVVVWGANNDVGTIVRVEAAIEDPSGWSSSETLYDFKGSPPPAGLFDLRLVGDDQDRFLVSLHGSNGDTTAAMWGLPAGSKQWQTVTPPQVADGSLHPSVAAKVASVNGTITAAWQDTSGAVVVSTWDGSTWTTPVTAIAARYIDGYPLGVDPFLVSDSSHAALVWTDFSKGGNGPLEATIRGSSGAAWSAPLVLPHSHGLLTENPFAGKDTLDNFWLTASGALAGVWSGDPYPRGLYVGSVSTNATSATVLSRAQNPNNGRFWFVLPRAGGLHTIVWANKKGREYATTTTTGAVEQTGPLPTCGYPGGGASNPDALSQVLLFSRIGPYDRRTKCLTALLW